MAQSIQRRKTKARTCTYVCTVRRCRLPRTILSRSRPEPRKDLLVVFFVELFVRDCRSLGVLLG